MASSKRAHSALLLLAEHQPQIALAALSRLRWIAVIGQIAAIAVAWLILQVRLPLLPVLVILLFTALSNALLMELLRRGRSRDWLVQAVLLSDVLALTALLHYAGGSRNPFAVLYLVHVAMAVIVLGSTWAWAIVATSALCYGAMFHWYVPLLAMRPMPDWVVAGGHWIALVLVSVLIANFIGHVEHLLRQRETELADARDRAARSERLASLTTLAAGAAHELNTPLGTIAVVARELELCATSGSDLSTAREDAQLIRQEVERCRGIIQRMRVAIGDGAQTGHRVEIDALIQYLREQLRPDEAQRFEVQWSRQFDAVTAPPRALEQALLVLLRNAFDASPALSRVTLAITQQDGHARFEVTDHGSGMTSEQLQRAGEPFFTTKEPGQGMGLGLFLVRLVAERCGASFNIVSEPGRGTRCILELPTVCTNNAAAAAAQELP